MKKTKTKIHDSSTYEVNTPEVVAEIIDAELVAINLAGGYYYHGNKSGSTIWSLITHNYTVEEMISYMSQSYNADPIKLQVLVQKYLDKLLQEKLIRVATKAKKRLDMAAPVTQLKLETPTLRRHEDMKELLLLDPIHDIGDQAWPLQEVR